MRGAAREDGVALAVEVVGLTDRSQSGVPGGDRHVEEAPLAAKLVGVEQAVELPYLASPPLIREEVAGGVDEAPVGFDTDAIGHQPACRADDGLANAHRR